MKFHIFLLSLLATACIPENRDGSEIQSNAQSASSICAFDPADLLFRSLAVDGQGWNTPLQFTAGGPINGSHREGFVTQFTKDLHRMEYKVGDHTFKQTSDDPEIALQEFNDFAAQKGIPKKYKEKLLIANQEFQANIIDPDSKVRLSLAQEFGIENPMEMIFVGNDSRFVFFKEPSNIGDDLWLLRLEYENISIATFDDIESPLGITNVHVTVKLDDITGTPDAGFSVMPSDVQYVLGIHSDGN